MDSPTMAHPGATLADLPLPRRVAIATLFAQLLSTERALAALYGGAAEQTAVPYLRAAFQELAVARRTRVGVLEALSPRFTLDSDGREPAPEPPALLPGSRAEAFAQAFQAERTLEVAYREIRALLGDPRRCPALGRLETDSVRDRARLRDLYLRYS